MVSVLTITYNRAYLIGETIKSVLNQTYQDFEYVIVDDGSEDNTEEVVKGFNDHRIRYLQHPKIGFLSKLRNYGIKNCKGEFIALIDSDDLWEKEKLALQIDMLKSKSDLGFCFCDVLIFRDNEILKHKIYSSAIGEYYYGNLFSSYINNQLPIYSSSTIVFKKSCFEVLGGLDESMKSGDHNFICRLLLKYDGCVIYRSLTKIRRHHANHSDNSGILPFSEYIISLKQFYKEGIISKKVYVHMMCANYYMAGIFLLKRQEYSNAQHQFIRSFKLSPLSNYKAIARYVMCIFKIPYRMK